MQGLLIVNNDQQQREQLAGIFEEDAYHIVTTCSVSDGLEAILDRKIQVIVLAGDYNEQRIAKLVPLLKKCNRHLSIILVANQISIELLRCIRKAGIFYHALPPANAVEQEEIHQAVSCAFKNYQNHVNAPGTIKPKEDAMLNTKSLLTTLSLILLAVPAMAADTTKVYTSGLLVLLFVGFCALLVVAQLLPAVMNLMGMTKNVAKSGARKGAHAKN